MPKNPSKSPINDAHKTAPSSGEILECHIIYDSQHQDRVPYPDAEVIRTPSPEHTGIPARPVKMPPIRSWQQQQQLQATLAGNSHAQQLPPAGYTSDDSNSSSVDHVPPAKPIRRKVTISTATGSGNNAGRPNNQKNSSVRSLVQKYNC